MIPPSPRHDYPDPEDSFRRRWPPKQFPGLHLSAEEYSALRRRERRRRQLLDLLGPDIADIAIAIMEERHEERV
jgi:hypothetical protein